MNHLRTPIPTRTRASRLAIAAALTVAMMCLGFVSPTAASAASPPSDNYFPIANQTRDSSGCNNNFSLGGHEGTDCFAALGVPLIAPEAGSIEYVNPYGTPFNCSTRTGHKSGNNLSLTGNSGTRYYFGHLDSFEVTASESVAKGEIIGYVGETGNAACSSPHLHLQISDVNNRTPVAPHPLIGSWTAHNPGGTTPPPTGTPNPNLPWVRPGHSGAAVRCVQNGLNVASGAGLAVDGNYGSRTTTSVQNFQRFFGLAVDGQVGPQTGGVLAYIYDLNAGSGAWAATGCYGLVPAR